MSLKKSKAILLAITAFGSFTLSGCDNPPDDNTTVNNTSDMIVPTAQCEQIYSHNECRGYIDAAEEEHEKTAPKYEFRTECDANHDDQCGAISTRDGTLYMPLMYGFVMGQMAGRRVQQPVYVGPKKDCAPNTDCQTRNVYSGHGVYVGQASYARAGSSVARSGSVSTSSVSSVARGGFGSTASAHGGGGGE